MKKTLLILLISFWAFAQSPKKVYMLQGSGEPYNQVSVQNFVNHFNGTNKFYWDVNALMLYTYDNGSSSWVKVVNGLNNPQLINQNLEQVLTTGNTATKEIKLNVSQIAPAVTIKGTDREQSTLNLFPYGFFTKDASGKKVIDIYGSTGINAGMTITNGFNSQIKLDGNANAIVVNNGVVGVGNKQTILRNGDLVFSNDGITNVLKPRLPLNYNNGSGFWFLPQKAGDLAVINTTAPSSPTDSGVVGEIRVTPTAVYICYEVNKWVKIPALENWSN